MHATHVPWDARATLAPVRITKYEHSALLLSKGDDILVIDPGNFLSLTDFLDVVGVVVTHEHADHWTDDNLTRILKDSPEARILGPAGVAAAATSFTVETVAAGDAVEVGPFSLRFFGGRHAVIHSSIPVIDNVGVLVDDEFYYAGDSFAAPGVPVGTLAVPAGAPWLKLSEAMDYVLEVKPKRAFPVHEMPLSLWGVELSSARLAWAVEQGGGQFHRLAPTEALDI